MAKILIGYYSRTGNTKKMAHLIEEGVREENVEVVVKDVKDIDYNEFLDYQGIILGSPTYYGTMSGELKKLLDDSVGIHGKLEGRVGGAFTSSALKGGGNETTILSIIQAFLIHGMVIQGIARGDHYGPVSIKAPDDADTAKQCREYGKRIARLVKKLFP